MSDFLCVSSISVISSSVFGIICSFPFCYIYFFLSHQLRAPSCVFSGVSPSCCFQCCLHWSSDFISSDISWPSFVIYLLGPDCLFSLVLVYLLHVNAKKKKEKKPQLLSFFFFKWMHIRLHIIFSCSMTILSGEYFSLALSPPFLLPFFNLYYLSIDPVLIFFHFVHLRVIPGPATYRMFILERARDVSKVAGILLMRGLCVCVCVSTYRNSSPHTISFFLWDMTSYTHGFLSL